MFSFTYIHVKKYVLEWNFCLNYIFICIFFHAVHSWITIQMYFKNSHPWKQIELLKPTNFFFIKIWFFSLQQVRIILSVWVWACSYLEPWWFVCLGMNCKTSFQKIWNKDKTCMCANLCAIIILIRRRTKTRLFSSGG